MDKLTLVYLTSLWLGILTSVSPCPLASNITAISYLGGQINTRYSALFSGLFYAAGRTIAYFFLCIIIKESILSIPEVANFLQKHINKLLGPVLIIAGLFLLEVIKFTGGGIKINEKIQKKAANNALIGSLFLGILFAFAFCPVSAALFFGSLIPLSLKYNSFVLLPLIYGIGTAVPVIFFSVIISFSVQSVGRILNKLSFFEFWTRKAVGIIFIVSGIYFLLRYVFGFLQ